MLTCVHCTELATRVSLKHGVCQFETKSLRGGRGILQHYRKVLLPRAPLELILKLHSRRESILKLKLHTLFMPSPNLSAYAFAIPLTSWSAKQEEIKWFSSIGFLCKSIHNGIQRQDTAMIIGQDQYTIITVGIIVKYQDGVMTIETGRN